MAQPIQAIVMTYATKPDINGNTYSFSLIWSVSTGRNLPIAIDDCSASNAKSYLYKFFKDYEPTLCLEQNGMSKTDWKEQKRISRASYHTEKDIMEALELLIPVK